MITRVTAGLHRFRAAEARELELLKLQKSTKQIAGELQRKYYTDDYFDLFVWFDDKGAAVQYQLCYDKHGDEHCLTYSRQKGLTHEKVNDGGENPLENDSPILLKDGSCPVERIMREFTGRSAELEKEVVDFVLEGLKNHD